MSRLPLKAKDIDEIWRSIDEDLGFSDSQNQRIVDTVELWDATTRAVAKQDRKRLAPAHRVLMEWCVAQRQEVERHLESIELNDKRLAKHVFNRRILALEKALAGTEGFVCTLPRLREWHLVAPMIWQEAAQALRSKNCKAGTSANSVAVRFSSKVLRKIGYSDVTSDAVRSVVELFVRARNLSQV